MNPCGGRSLWSTGSWLSLWSEGSVLSIGSVGSVLSIGSVGSFASLGGIGSALSLASLGSYQSQGSVLSRQSQGSVLSNQSRDSVLSSQSSRSFGRVRSAGDLPRLTPALRVVIGAVASPSSYADGWSDAGRPVSYGEIPTDVDAETHRRIARSFYLARMVRLSMLLGFAVVFLVVVVVRDEPGWAVVVFGVLALAVVSLLWRTRQRWRAAQGSFGE